MSEKFFRDRFSVISFIIIILILVIAYKLFTLQIVKGQYYRGESEKKLLRINTIEAPRGEILDRFNKVLANSRAGFIVRITKTKIDDDELNTALLETVKILEKNKETYKDNLPINIPFQFLFNSPKEEEVWKKKHKITLSLNAKQTFAELRVKYKIDTKVNDNDARKMLALRYEMSEQGYQSYKSVDLAYDVSKETISEIEERHNKLPGISIAVIPIRNYPNGALGAHILGYISKINQNELDKLTNVSDEQKLLKEYGQNDIVGKNGIEGYSEVYLKGIDGKKFVESDVNGGLARSLEKDPVPGGKVTLTIDMELQKIAENALKDTITKISDGGFKDKHSDVKGGAAIAVNVNTGEILALANYPNFDPGVFSKGVSIREWNRLNNDPLKPLFNRALTGAYPPGSTFKMITAMGALEEGKITPTELIEDKGVYTHYEKNGPACWLWRQSNETHGFINVSDALKVSCNYYFYEIGRRLGIEKIGEYAARFGLGQKTNIEISGEIKGAVASISGREKNGGKWYPGNTLQAAIGQSDTSVTPISVASYISTLANGGTRYQLHIIKDQKSYDGTEVYTDNSSLKILEQLNFKTENLKAIFNGMKSVADEQGGTAYSTFKDFPIVVAGKTGSAQTGISGQSAHAWFTGFAPIEKPEIAVVVLIENGGSGGYTAPVAKEIFAQYFKVNQTPIDEPVADNKNTEIDSTITEPITGQVN